MSESQTFQNDKIHVTLETKPQCKVALKIEIQPAFAKHCYEQALKKVKKEVSLPGFRKGRAPDDMIINKYGPQVTVEFHQHAANEAFYEALTLAHTQPYNRERQKVNLKYDKEPTSEEGGILSAEFEAFPEIPTVNTADIQLKTPPKKEISEEAIEKHLNYLSVQKAQLEEVTDRPAQEGDVVTIEFYPDGKPEQSRPLNDLHLKKPFIEDEVYHAVVGMSLEEKKEGQDLVKDAEEKIHFTVILKKIKAGELPEANDELAKEYGIESLEKLREEIEKEYKKSYEKEQHEELVYALEDQLAEKYPFEVPQSAVEMESSYRFANMVNSVPEGQLTDEMQKQIEEKSKEFAAKATRIQFLIAKVRSDNAIKPSDDELRSNLFNLYMQYQQEINDGHLKMDDLQAMNYSQVANRAAVDYLVKNATYVD